MAADDFESSYCRVAPGHPFHGPYHDTEYGFPITADAALLERLSLEIAQAGLSWLIVLKKQQGFRAAFRGFDPTIVAAFGGADVERLMGDAGIIRNRRKIEATIANGRTVLDLRASHGSFDGWLAHHHPLALDDWLTLFRKTFKFTGREVVNEFLMSIGYLPGAHHERCPVYATIARLDPPWMRG